MRMMRVASSLCLIGLVSTAGPVDASPGAASHIDSLSAQPDGELIRVEGQATFVSVPTILGTDPAGDAPQSGLGLDLTSVTVAWPPPGGSVATFVMKVSDPVPLVAAVPIGAQYTITVGGGILQAQRTQVVLLSPSPTWIEPRFQIVFSQQLSVVEGRMEDGTIEWNVPISKIPHSPGQALAGGEARTQLAPVWNVADAMGIGSFAVPVADVRVGIAPEGTPESSVALTRAAAIGSGSAFSGSLQRDSLPPGSYIVVAEACYGGNSCGRASTSVWLP